MKILAAILLGIFLVGCHRPAPDGITKIELAKGICYGSCIPIAISIDDSLHYKFYADSSPSWNKVRPKKEIVSYVGTADRQLWNKLMKNFDSIDYKHLDTSKGVEIADAQRMELIIYFGGDKIRVTQSTVKLDKVINLLDSSSQQVKLIPTADTLHFGTKLQFEYQYMHSLNNIKPQ